MNYVKKIYIYLWKNVAHLITYLHILSGKKIPRTKMSFIENSSRIRATPDQKWWQYAVIIIIINKIYIDKCATRTLKCEQYKVDRKTLDEFITDRQTQTLDTVMSYLGHKLLKVSYNYFQKTKNINLITSCRNNFKTNKN